MNNPNKQCIGLLGATSLVGECLLQQLTENKCSVIAFSRNCYSPALKQGESTVNWHQLQASTQTKVIATKEKIDLWITVAPIWTLPEHFELLLSHGIKRIVALSSTSRFTKVDSSNSSEQTISRRLIEGERRLRIWAVNNNIDWIILRPTLIYGQGQDKNITEIVRFIRRFGFFPLLGSAEGLRQPLHAEDVAAACFSALMTFKIVNQSYNLAGGETLRYREMVERVFVALENKRTVKFSYPNRHLRLLTVPRWAFQLAVVALNWLPRYRHWNTAMADRMNNDLVFDCSEAMRDFDFAPRQFNLGLSDLPDSFNDE